MLVILGMPFLALFFRWVLRQHQHSSHHMEDWGHAYVIPLIAGYFVFRRRKQIAIEPPMVFWPGLAPLLMGVMTYFAGIVTIQNHMIQGFSVVLALFGLCLLMMGPRVMRWGFLPLVMLLFTVTISDAIMAAVTFQLQLLASQGSHILLSLIGAPFGWFDVEVDGNVLTMITGSGEHIPLNVAEACSGMRMVIAFYALAAAVALLSCPRWWQRIGVVLIAGPVAILMNIVRVTVLGLLSLFDPGLAGGDAHTLIGTVLLVPSLALFLGVVWAMKKIVNDDKPDAASGADVSKGATA